ncbi:MAG: hypothetical protein ACKV2V_14265 [Blastocatellia bacterium]
MKITRKTLSILWISITSILLTTALAVSVNDAVDASDFGPLQVTSAEYKLPAAIDLEVLNVPAPNPPRAVELWARVWRPADLSGGPRPLIVFLHGNHATCGIGENPRFDDRTDYTTLGTCPGEYLPVPNHMGYAYLAERLASWGYLVVSINANRGITAGAGYTGDLGLNLARGALVLRHLERLSAWNRNGNTPASLGVDLRGKIDFSYVGLMGHSRGGEGMRAAYNLYRDQGSSWPGRIGPARFQGIFEIGPVDGQTGRILDADNTAWSVLLPMCDGDVSNLQGARPYDRALFYINETNQTPKSTYTVWGANHNYYNSEWQTSESGGCWGHAPLFTFNGGGSAAQQQSAISSLITFFRANVGPDANPALNQLFNPLYRLPASVTAVSRVDRGYTESPAAGPTYVLEDFDQVTGTSTNYFANEASNVSVTHINLVTDGTRTRHDPFQRVGVLIWTAAGADRYFQANFSNGTILDYYKTLDFRVSRRYSPALNGNLNSTTDFSVQLVAGDGTVSAPLPLSRYANLTGPVGGAGGGNLHAILQSVRIPLRDFRNIDLRNVSGVRFTFDRTRTGTIFLGNIRASLFDGELPAGAGTVSDETRPAIAGVESNAEFIPAGENAAPVEMHKGSIRAITRSNAGRGLAVENAGGLIDIEIASSDNFPPLNELPVLVIDGREFLLGRYPGNGETNRMLFTLTQEEYDSLQNGAEVRFQYGRGNESVRRWELGQLDKTALR